MQPIQRMLECVISDSISPPLVSVCQPTSLKLSSIRAPLISHPIYIEGSCISADGVRSCLFSYSLSEYALQLCGIASSVPKNACFDISVE